MGAPGTTEGEWYFEKCGCGHKSCSQYYLGNQGSVGFSLADAQQIAASGSLYDAASEALGALNTVSGWQGPYALSGAEADRVIDKLRIALAQARGEVSVHTLEGGL